MQFAQTFTFIAGREKGKNQLLIFFLCNISRSFMNILLRPFTINDAPALQAAADNKKIADNLRNTFPNPYSIEDAREYIGAVAQRSPQTDFIIEVDGEFAGRIAIDLKDDIYSTTAEIGYWIAESHWGKGIASKAIALTIDYFKRTFDRVRLFAVCFETNTGSRKALEKNGFTLECIRPKAVIKNGQILNDCVYTIIF